MNILRKILFPFGIVYWVATYLRNLFYDLGIFKSYKIPVKSIAVGNLNVGGTGKTPHIEYLIRLLHNKKIATLSRGYGRTSKGFILANETTKANEIGDEPFQFYSKFPEISVAVDANRKNGVEILQYKINPEVILLDDAFQHRKVSAGFYILLTDYNHLFTKDFILPFGNLREPSLGKKRANVIIVTKCPENLSEIARKRIKQNLRVEVPVFFSSIEYDKKCYSKEEEITISDLSESKVIVAGIANPTSFISFLKKEDDEVLIFSDHHDFTDDEVKQILAKANGRKIISTEKDFMRLQDKISPAQLYYLPIKVTIDNKEFDKLIQDYVG